MKTLSLTRLIAAASCLACVIATVAVAGPPRLGPGPIDPTLPVERPVKPALPTLPGTGSMMIESRLGFMIDTPLLAFNNTGVLTYTAGDGLLTVTADPLAMLLVAGDPPVLIFPTAGGKAVEIGVELAANGSLIGGVAGDDLLVTGRVDLGGDVRDGILLTGEVTEYMGENGSGTTDFHSFRFTVTGGLLADIYGADVAIELTSEMSTFTGNYGVNFDGEAKGNIGVVECTGTIGDFVWLDLDGNGIQDDGEEGIPGVQLILTDADGNTTTTSTNSSGFYQFTGLCAGTYTIAVNPDSLPPDVDITLINAPGSNDANDSNDPAGTPVTLTQNDSMDQDTDFGYVPVTASLGDYVWEDLNMDGVNDGNEPPIGDVMVNLYDCAGNFIASTTTNASGFYEFTGLAAGCYQVEFIRPDGFVITLQDQNGEAFDSDPDPTTGLTGDINLGAGENNPDIDAGMFRPPSAELGDRFFEDLNGNGIQDLGEPGIEGVTVNLLDCAGNVLDTTITGSNGEYLFPDLPAGCYIVEFVAPVNCILTEQNAGMNDAVDSDANPANGQTGNIDLSEMESDLTWDAGCYYPAGLGDFVWNDLDQDGVQDPGEPGIEGLTVVLLDSLMMPTGLTDITGPNGEYEFTGLTPGSYFVQFTAPAGFVYTLQNIGATDTDSNANGTGKTDKITLESGDFDPTIDAGVYVPDDPQITIEKSTNGFDADDPTGPFILNGEDVLWEYVVTNTGNVTLTNIEVIDSQNVIVTCDVTTLDPMEMTTCTGTGPATVDQYMNLGTVTGDPPQGDPVTDNDPSHYFGANPSIDIEKATNGFDADDPTGPFLTPGSTVNWTYVVTNTGNVPLTDIEVTDDQNVDVSCPLTTLPANGGTMTCNASGVAVAGQYENLGTVVGTPIDNDGTPIDNPISDMDPSHYFGAVPSIDIEKATNGFDADDPTGPLVAPGSVVTWTYVVTNTGNVALSNVIVTDNVIGTIDCAGQNTLAPSGEPGDSFTCTATGTAQLDQYANTGTVVGTPPQGPNVDDVDPSHYFGAQPDIDIEKATNGADADTPTGPFITVGEDVNWTYVVTNTGNIPLTNVSVTDNQNVIVDCPQNTLAVDETIICNAMGISTDGQYANIGTVTGDAEFGGPVDDSDPSHYFGANPGIDIEKATNGEDADTPTGPIVEPGSTVTWTYVVINTGNVALTNVTVTDNRPGVTIDCGANNSLAPAGEAGDTFTCTATGIAIEGQYDNVGTVVGTPPVGPDVNDADPSHYFGANPAIDLEKLTNGENADNPTGPVVPVGSTVTWTYIITNMGNVPLENITLNDDVIGAVVCNEGAIPTLNPGDNFVCTVMGTATIGQYVNNGTTCGTDPRDMEVCDEDPSHYFGAMPSIDIEKATNTIDADDPTGPFINPGDLVTWTYVVTNTGNVELTNVVVTDNQPGVVVDCGANNSLAPAGEAGDSFTCTASGIAIVGQYANIGSVVGTPPAGAGDPVGDSDPSHYFGANPVIDIEKLTNGVNADLPTGPVVAVGSTVTWTYIISNMGNVDLNNITLIDSDLGNVVCDEGPIPSLAPGANFICTTMGTAVAGQYENLGTTCGTDAANTEVCDEDPSHYLGADPSIDIEKDTNGMDADDPTGPLIETGGPVTWTYVVTNTGNVPLTNVMVSDNQPGVIVDCGSNNSLAAAGQPGDSFSCTATGTAVAGQYRNDSTVVGTSPLGTEVTDADPSHYFGVTPGVVIEKLTNGVNADDPNAGDAPQILPGDTVTWTYIVTNTGNVALSGVTVTDDQVLSIDCGGQDTLAPAGQPGDSFTCIATGLAADLATATGTVTGMCGTRPNQPLYENLGTVSGMTPLGATVSDNDPSHYCNPEVCALTVNKTCLIPTPPASTFTCDKPIDSLTMIYNGTQPVRIKAWKGPVGSTLLADIDDVTFGEEVSVMGYAGSPNDVFWEVFIAGSSSKLGESNFHLSCSDDAMDGPEDCGLPQGDGKSNDSNLLNTWLLEGMVDASGTLDCTPPATTGVSECEFQAFPASCETGNADFLTFQYTGGGCGASNNGQQSDHTCSGSVNGNNAATFVDDDGNSVTLQPGETVTIPRNLAKVMQLSNGAGTETNSIHTSCSQPIAAGDIYGSLTLVQIDGMGIGTNVIYAYEITNTSDVDIVSLAALDNVLGPIPGAPSSLGAGMSVTLNDSAFITETVTNIAIIDGTTADGQMCNGTSQATVTILPPPPCDVEGEGVLDISSDKIKWVLTNNGAFTATIESVEISWPNANGDLIEVNLDGTIFQSNRSPNSTIIGANDWINDLDRRQIPPGDSGTLEVKFDNDAVGAASDYSITINFEEGCSVTFENTGLPFECNTDITELSMIWDGSADPIRVKAWKGSAGSSDLLLDLSGVTQGQKVTVPGYANSGNDVFWEVFSGGTKLGESNFHMSCSDNDMNGAEDCGKRQGNGKGNDSGLVNDWLLEGMVDADGPFDCSNLP